MCFSLPSLPSVHFLAHVRHPLSLSLFPLPLIDARALSLEELTSS